MNKKITLYELLGLVKDGQAPKRIKYKDNIYDYKESENGTGYVRPLNLNGLEWLANRVDIDDKDVLNDEVEILEEEKKIEKINLSRSDGNISIISKENTIIQDKINEIIDEINKIKEKKE